MFLFCSAKFEAMLFALCKNDDNKASIRTFLEVIHSYTTNYEKKYNKFYIKSIKLVIWDLEYNYFFELNVYNRKSNALGFDLNLIPDLKT